jgi:hypothetical protein
MTENPDLPGPPSSSVVQHVNGVNGRAAQPAAVPIPNDETALRDRAREALRSGKLPNRNADHTWGGPGEGACCAVCSAPVGPAETEFELANRSEAGSSDARVWSETGCTCVLVTSAYDALH